MITRVPVVGAFSSVIISEHSILIEGLAVGVANIISEVELKDGWVRLGLVDCDVALGVQLITTILITKTKSIKGLFIFLEIPATAVQTGMGNSWLEFFPHFSGTVEEDRYRVQDIPSKDADGLVYQQELTCKLVLKEDHLKFDRVGKTYFPVITLHFIGFAFCFDA